MGRILRRLGIFAVTLLGASILIFAVTAALPGDIAQVLLGTDATPEAVQRLRRELGLDRPLPVRYLEWLGGVLTGNFGVSHLSKQPVLALLGPPLTVTAWLVGLGIVGSLLIALPAGMVAALRRRHWQGFTVNALAQVGMAIPVFFGGILIVLIFAVWLRWLPAVSLASEINTFTDLLRAFTMPVITLFCVISAQMIRMTRAAVIETLRAPYVEMALLKGASRSRMVLRHALPNAIGPIVNAVALSLSYLLGGVIIVETVFNYPGIAKLMVDAVSTRDLPLIQTCVMIFCIGYLMLVTIADVIAIVSNPRLRK